MKINVKVQGLDGARLSIENIRKQLSDDVVLNVMMTEGAIPLAAEVRSAAPQLTGATKRAVVAKPGAKRQLSPAAFMSIDFSLLAKPGAEKSRYPYIVEHGSKPHIIKPRNGKMLRINGRLVPFARHPGFAARYFFRNAVRSKTPSVRKAIAERLGKLIQYGAGL